MCRSRMIPKACTCCGTFSVTGRISRHDDDDDDMMISCPVLYFRMADPASPGYNSARSRRMVYGQVNSYKVLGTTTTPIYGNIRDQRM